VVVAVDGGVTSFRSNLIWLVTLVSLITVVDADVVFSSSIFLLLSEMLLETTRGAVGIGGIEVEASFSVTKYLGKHAFGSKAIISWNVERWKGLLGK
jgi:hypothetical protein